MKLLLILLFSIGILLLRSWAFLNLWIWFVVPLNAPQISLSHTMGLLLIISLVTPTQSFDSKDKTLIEQIKDLGIAICSPIFILSLGYVVKMFL